MATPKKTTRIADDTTVVKPQTTIAGDAPADTWEPNERVTSVRPDKAAAATAGHQTVNAVIPVASIPAAAPTGTRTETYKQVTPSGVQMTVTHNYDTGVTAATATPTTPVTPTPTTPSTPVTPTPSTPSTPTTPANGG